MDKGHIHKLSKKQIFLESFPDIVSVSLMSKVEDSLYLTIGIFILQTLIRLKDSKDISQSYRSLFESYFESIRSFASNSESLKFFENFERAYNSFMNKPRKESMDQLESYSCEENTQLTVSIASTIKFLISILLANKQISYYNVYKGSINQDDLSNILKFLSEIFYFHIKLIWDAGNWDFSTPKRTELLFYIYVCDQGYGILHHKAEENFDNDPSSIIAYDKFPFYVQEPENIKIENKIPENVKEQEKSIEPHDNKSVIASFINVLGLFIAENQLNLCEINNEIIRVGKIVPEIYGIDGIKEIQKLYKDFCDKHNMEFLLKLNCGRSHCKKCIYEIVKANSNNLKNIFCQCGIRISPKMIFEIKKTFNNKNNNST